METSVIKDSRRSLSTNTESLFLHVVKHNLLIFFLFYMAFFHEYSRFTGQHVKGKAISLFAWESFHHEVAQHNFWKLIKI